VQAELGVVEQRYRAVLDVLEEGASVTEVARRHGMARQTVHEWLARYAAGGLGGPADRSSRPASCPHQMPAVVEARIVGMRRDHPGWGPSPDPVRAGAGGRGAAARAVGGVPGADPARLSHPPNRSYPAASSLFTARRWLTAAPSASPGDAQIYQVKRTWPGH
jgi:hypothetical protein